MLSFYCAQKFCICDDLAIFVDKHLHQKCEQFLVSVLHALACDQEFFFKLWGMGLTELEGAD